MSFGLRFRLGLIISLLMTFALIGSLSYLMISAKSRLQQELDMLGRVTNQLMALAVESGGLVGDIDNLRAKLSQIAYSDQLSELRIFVSASGWDYTPHYLDDERPVQAPGWFVEWLHPQPLQVIFAHTLVDGGVVIIRADPIALIEDQWQEVRFIMFSRVLVILLIAVTIIGLVGYWFRPMDAIIAVLENVEHGDFSRKVPNMPLPELNKIGEKINRLTIVLGASRTENQRLARKSLTIQEQERRYLAQELHDVMGQSISAIKAIAYSIYHSTRDTNPDVSVNAEKIGIVSSDIYRSVREMMVRLRPSVLDELGLVEALRQMVDDWNENHQDSFCRLRIDGDFDNLREEHQIHIYRIVQEALTNVAKHAKADNVSISLSGSEVITLTISDDGKGFDSGLVDKGMGLTNIRERVGVLRGHFSVNTQPGKGVDMQIEIPRTTRDRRKSSGNVRTHHQSNAG